MSMPVPKIIVLHQLEHFLYCVGQTDIDRANDNAVADVQLDEMRDVVKES